MTPSFESENLVLSTFGNASSITLNNAAYLDIGIRSSHGNVENFICALSSPNRELRGTELPDIIFGRADNDTFVAFIENDATDTITDFTDGDKVRIDVDDPSAITDLASL